MSNLMRLRILLPYEKLSENTEIKRIVAETQSGSFGILPRRLDCVAALSPGILTYEAKSGEETFVAIDEGVLVKTGLDVVVSVHNAVSGTDLSKLRQLVEEQFLQLSEEQTNVKSILKKMESSFITSLAELHNV